MREVGFRAAMMKEREFSLRECIDVVVDSREELEDEKKEKKEKRWFEKREKFKNFLEFILSNNI